jgi:hypothetical protein
MGQYGLLFEGNSGSVPEQFMLALGLTITFNGQ